MSIQYNSIYFASVIEERAGACASQLICDFGLHKAYAIVSNHIFIHQEEWSESEDMEELEKHRMIQYILANHIACEAMRANGWSLNVSDTEHKWWTWR